MASALRYRLWNILKFRRKIVGWSLIAEGQTEAEVFCATLPKAFKEGRGSIDIVPDVGGKYKIIFVNEGCCFGGTFEVMVTEEQGKAIQELLKDAQKLGLYKDGLFGPGFKIVLISEKDKHLARTEIKA